MISVINAPVVVANFTHRLVHAIYAFTDPTRTLAKPHPEPASRDDAADLRAFLRPLTGQRGAELGVRHARFRARDGKRETVTEYISGKLRSIGLRSILKKFCPERVRLLRYRRNLNIFIMR